VKGRRAPSSGLAKLPIIKGLLLRQAARLPLLRHARLLNAAARAPRHRWNSTMAVSDQPSALRPMAAP
jgi:hypothetical protein